QIHERHDDIERWRKQVEIASEFAVSQVFSHKKPHSRASSLPVPLQSREQLKDHDDAYSEAQALLGDWLSSKLRTELKMEEEDDVMNSTERSYPVALVSSQPEALTYNKFDDLYNCLAEEEEHSAVNRLLQDLMEQEVLDSRMMDELALDIEQTRKKFRDPSLTMEARHQQVRKNRAQREAERQRQQSEREALRDARHEAKGREREKEMKKKQEAWRQEEMVQQEMVRLRRKIEEKRALEQLARQRERNRMEGQSTTTTLQSAPILSTEQQHTEQLFKERKIQSMCLQGHFSQWYTVILDRRLRMGKAMAFWDWKRQLQVWRAWRTMVWAQQKQREVARTEEELRIENRQCQLAVESNRRRLLRRCLNEWQIQCQSEREQRELLPQQQETRRKMAALISAVSTGKLKATETPAYQRVIAPSEASNHPETTQKVAGAITSDAKGPIAEAINNFGGQPTQPWQVTRRHVALTAAELQNVRQRGDGGGSSCSKSTASPGSMFENRHATQQQIIAQQRKLLKEQLEQIAKLKEEQTIMGLELEMKKTVQTSQLLKQGGSRPKSDTFDHTEKSEAMEARARQRIERRKEIEELKRKKEEKKLAEMKAAEEQRLKEEEEDKRNAAEKRKEERRLEKEREEEKQRQLKKQQELLKLAREHYHRTVLLRRGLAPWKRLIQLRQANIQLADSHHNLILLRRCVIGWQQSARESLSEKAASADQLHRRFLLRRILSCWKSLKDWRMIQEERAEHFYRTHTLKRFLMALQDQVTQARLVEWDHQELAQEHNNRRVLQRFFQAWRQLPCLLRKEKERERRRQKLGRKVAEVLPDFCSHPL
uniref:Coiled-coil domain containing 191 n=1 Tax=Echeneis naucrates TaxID=173247 RepID=A0A665V4S3_ECHNA